MDENHSGACRDRGDMYTTAREDPAPRQQVSLARRNQRSARRDRPAQLDLWNSDPGTGTPGRIHDGGDNSRGQSSQEWDEEDAAYISRQTHERALAEQELVLYSELLAYGRWVLGNLPESEWKNALVRGMEKRIAEARTHYRLKGGKLRRRK